MIGVEKLSIEEKAKTLIGKKVEIVFKRPSYKTLYYEKITVRILDIQLGVMEFKMAGRGNRSKARVPINLIKEIKIE